MTKVNVNAKSISCNVTVIGAGPYGLSSAAYLRAARVETRVFGEPMSFWEKQMPVGMCLRSNWGASHIAAPQKALTLDEYSLKKGNHIPKPIPLDRFVVSSRPLRRLNRRFFMMARSPGNLASAGGSRSRLEKLEPVRVWRSLSPSMFRLSLSSRKLPCTPNSTATPISR